MTDNFSEFVTILTGDLSAVLAMEAVLRGEGFHPFRPNRNTVVGGDFFSALAVPASEAQKALACLEAFRANAPVAGGGESAPETVTEHPEALGRRLRWGFLLTVFVVWPSWPLATLTLAIYVAFHIKYLLRVKKSGALPEGHVITVTCLVLTILLYCFFQFFRWV